ncbi:hypothetical protein XENORESO_019647 [Xenotaenia resolanae]|uniref:Uncharacterized protein n=1 Tax=Xenotaenia resolanae TaxID=208358 RepID=A0ABV0W9D5_9TELE
MTGDKVFLEQSAEWCISLDSDSSSRRRWKRSIFSQIIHLITNSRHAATTSTTDADSLVGRIEVLVASIKRRSQRLYKDTDGNKACAKIRRKIREEKGILTLAVEKYNRMVPDT